MINRFEHFINESTSDKPITEIVSLLRSVSKKFELSGFEVIIPEKDGKNYPLNIAPGTYTKQEIADALHFIADMIE